MTQQPQITIRLAVGADLDQLVKLLADDLLGIQREVLSEIILSAYQKAFKNITTDKNAELWVVEYEELIIGMAQVNYLTYLTYQGGIRAQVEGVRIHQDYRKQGIGSKLFAFIEEQAKRKSCHLLQ